jgi:hypothetical protein
MSTKMANPRILQLKAILAKLCVLIILAISNSNGSSSRYRGPEPYPSDLTEIYTFRRDLANNPAHVLINIKDQGPNYIQGELFAAQETFRKAIGLAQQILANALVAENIKAVDILTFIQAELIEGWKTAVSAQDELQTGYTSEDRRPAINTAFKRGNVVIEQLRGMLPQ